MRKIEKNFTPIKIVSEKVEQEFLINLSEKKHLEENKRYKIIHDELIEIYHNKCAYCEKNLSDTDSPVEHYRPKNKANVNWSKCENNYSYYWLAYSWSNLILSCKQCNGNKGNCFNIKGKRAEYSGENLKKLQYFNYDKDEMPLLINPEQLTESELEKQFYFEINGEIVGITDEMKYTIIICDLNRHTLKNEKRLNLLNTYLKRYQRAIFIKKENAEKEITRIIDELEIETNEKAEFTAWRKFIIQFFHNELSKNKK